MTVKTAQIKPIGGLYRLEIIFHPHVASVGLQLIIKEDKRL